MHFCYFCLDLVAESLGENDLNIRSARKNFLAQFICRNNEVREDRVSLFRFFLLLRISPSIHKTFLGLMSDRIYMSFSKCSALFRPSSCARRPRASVDDALSPIGSQSVSLIVQRDVASLFDESLVLTYWCLFCCFRFGYIRGIRIWLQRYKKNPIYQNEYRKFFQFSTVFKKSGKF